MFVTFAYGLGGQHQHAGAGGQMRQGSSHKSIRQQRVHPQRQVRAMLLGGTHRQQGHAAGCIQMGKVVRTQLGPIAWGRSWVRVGVIWLHARILKLALVWHHDKPLK